MDTPGGGVIVAGVDGSARSVPVLQWADEQARLTGDRLVALLAYGAGERSWADAAATAENAVRSAVAQALGPDRAREVETRIVAQAPGEALSAESKSADAVVLGVHSMHAVHPLRSVTAQVVRDARSPVVVVRKYRPVVHRVVSAGVSGSVTSRPALRWAVRQARLVGGTVDAVLAWEWQPEYPVFPYGSDHESVRRRHESELEVELDLLPASMRPAVRGRAVEGPPVHVLLNAAAHADLLVLGVDGRHTFTDHVLGSVNERMVRHAPVPVVLIHSMPHPDQ